MQQQLFTDKANQPKPNNSLSITRGGQQKLTKNQQAFNKLTARIEKLHKEIEKKQSQYDVALNIYSANVHPMRKELAAKKREVLNLIWPLYKRRQVSKSELVFCKNLLKNLLQYIFDYSDTEPDEELKKIFKELEGESYDAMVKREEAEWKEQTQDMFDDMDIDIDLMEEGLDNKTMAEKMAEAQQQLKDRMEREKEQKAHRHKHKKKTAKQLEKEKLQAAVDEMKQKNITVIYRQLAKLFHPDLEQDEERRVEKEELMKQLTAAYEAKNLHALLSLELKWIHKENDHLESLTEEKLAVYLEILREQAKGLEVEKSRLFTKPQYRVLYEEFGTDIITHPLRSIEDEKERLENDLESIETDINGLKGPAGQSHLKKVLAIAKSVQMDVNEEDIMNQLMEMLMTGKDKNARRW